MKRKKNADMQKPVKKRVDVALYGQSSSARPSSGLTKSQWHMYHHHMARYFVSHLLFQSGQSSKVLLNLLDIGVQVTNCNIDVFLCNCL